LASKKLGKFVYSVVQSIFRYIEPLGVHTSASDGQKHDKKRQMINSFQCMLT